MKEPLISFAIGQGVATLLSALVAAGTSLAVLLLTMRANRLQGEMIASLAQLKDVNQEAREYVLKQLTEFYDPIYALLSANAVIFERIGPTSEARRSGQFNDEETALVWQKLSDEVIVPNNSRVSEIIQSNLHFVTREDDEAGYIEFLAHSSAYKAFRQQTYQAYKLFEYPRALLGKIDTQRSALKARLERTYPDVP